MYGPSQFKLRTIDGALIPARTVKTRMQATMDSSMASSSRFCATGRIFLFRIVWAPQSVEYDTHASQGARDHT
jgi:hypothetical protein